MKTGYNDENDKKGRAMENETKKARHTYTVFVGFRRYDQGLNKPSYWVYESIREAWSEYHAFIKDLYKIYDSKLRIDGRLRKDLVLVIGLRINYEEYNEDTSEWIVIASASDSLREYDYAEYILDKELEDLREDWKLVKAACKEEL